MGEHANCSSLPASAIQKHCQMSVKDSGDINNLLWNVNASVHWKTERAGVATDTGKLQESSIHDRAFLILILCVIEKCKRSPGKQLVKLSRALITTADGPCRDILRAVWGRLDWSCPSSASLWSKNKRRVLSGKTDLKWLQERTTLFPLFQWAPMNYLSPRSRRIKYSPFSFPQWWRHKGKRQSSKLSRIKFVLPDDIGSF